MSDVMVYTIPGAPVPLLRAKASFKTHTIYNPQKTQQLISRVNLQEQHKDNPQFIGPLYIDITFHMPISKSKSNQKQKTKPRRLAQK
jgi:Holliday junction resolvase RusA-like endonuclease